MPKYVTQAQLSHALKKQKISNHTDMKNMLLNYQIKHADRNNLDKDSAEMIVDLMRNYQNRNEKRFANINNRFKHLDAKIDNFQRDNQKQFALMQKRFILMQKQIASSQISTQKQFTLIDHKLDSSHAVLNGIRKICKMIQDHI